MGILEAVILGIIQGLTEFLPVSSSGHIEIAKFFLGKDSVSEGGVFFTVLVHFATALSTIWVFRKDIIDIIKDTLIKKDKKSIRFVLFIIISMLPAVLVGLLFEDEIESLFNGQIVLVGCMLILTAILLFISDKTKNNNKDFGVFNSFLVGIAQAIAILPGISRSGATISTSLILGIEREKAARFSFLMVVPLIFGKMAKDILSVSGESMGGSPIYLIAGFVSAFLVGLFSCKLMIKLVKNSRLIYFSVYCLLIGGTVILIKTLWN